MIPHKSRHTYASDCNVLLASIAEDLGNGTLLLELKVHLCLVRLDLDEHITGRYRVANLLLPCANVSGGHGRGEGRHADNAVGWVGCGEWRLAVRPGRASRQQRDAHIWRHSTGRGQRGRVCVYMFRGQSVISGLGPGLVFAGRMLCCRDGSNLRGTSRGREGAAQGN